MVQYEREVNGRLKMTVEQDYRDFYRAESGGNMTIDGRTDRSVESPYGVVTYKHDTRKYTDFVRGLNDVHVIQFAAPFNNVEKSISSRPNILASTLSTIYDKVGWAQQLFPSETGMLMRTGQLSTLLMDKTNFKSTVQQPVALYDSEEALIKTQAQAQYHANKDGTVPEIIGNHEGSLQHAKLTEGLYSELIQKTIQKEFAGLGVTKPVPKAKAQFTGAMFTDVAIGGLSLTGSGGLVGAYEDYSIGFENPTIVNWFKEFRETGLREDRFVKEDAVSAKGVKVTGNLSIYEERNKQLTELVEILKVINPEGKNKGLANVVIASPSMDWNEFSRDASTKDQEQKKAVGQYIKLMQEVTKYGGNGVLIMDPSRINIPNNERRRLLRQWYIGSSKRGKDIHTNIQTIQLAKQTGLTEEQKALLQAKGLLEKAQTGIHTFNAGNFRPSGNYSINVEVGVDLLKADPATVKGTEWIEAQIALTHNAFLPRRDIAQEGIAGSMLREFYTPTFKDSQEGGFTQEGLLPNMPLSMPNSFFRYFKPGTRTHIYSDRYRALTGEYATGIQGDVLRQLDAKLSDPGSGYRLNYLLQQRDLYEPGKGVIGTAAAAVGRFIDTATGFYTLQTIQARESGQLRGSLRKLYESRQRDPYEETEARGFFENLLVKTAGTFSATTTAMAAYFGVTHAYTMARAQVEQVGVDYVLESIAKGHTEGVKGLFIKQLLDPSHQELVVQASKLYNADTTRMVIKNTGDALEAYFDLATRSSLQALQSKHSNLTNDFINAIVPVDEQTGGIKATDIGDKAKSVIEQVKAEAEGALKGENAASLAHDITRRLDEKISAQLAIAPDSVTPSYVRGLVTDIYKELGVDRDSGTIELGRPTDSISATRVTQPAGFSNLAGVRRLDTSNLQHMFIPLLDEMVLNKDSQAYKTAKQNLLRLSKASPILMYRQTANNIAASSDLKIYNYGYERMRQLAEVFDDLATQLPANPLMWIKPIRQAFMGSPTTATTTQQTLEQGEVTSMRHTFKELIGPGFTGLINLQGQITRELGQSFRTGIGGQLEVNFDLMRRSRIVQADAAELGKLIAESKGVSDLLQTTDADKFSRFIAGQTEYEGLLSKHRKDYEQMLTAEDSNSAYAGLRKALLGVGTVMIVDRLFDAFVLRPQGIDFFDSIKSDIFGTRSPALEGSEEDSRWQALYGTEYSNALPSIVKYPAAAAGFFVGGHLIPSYEIGENAVYAAARKKFAQDGINELSAFKTAIKSTATEGVEAVTQVGLRSQLVKTKFGTGGALLGASAALIGSQLAVNFAAATAKTIVQGTDHILSGGRWRDSESGLDVDPVKGSAAAALANIVQYSIQRQDALYKKGYAVTADDKTDVYLLNMASQGLTESSRKPSQMFYPFATQIASPFFQFASVAKVDPGKNVISLDAGLQLFPLLGAGVMMPVPITPKVQYTAPLSNRMIANYLRQYQEGIIVDAVPSTMEQDQEIEAFVNMQNISKASSMLLGGGVNLSFDSKPLVYLAMMGAGSDFAQRGMEKYLAFKKVQDGLEATKQSSLYKELRHYETLFHLGKVGFDTLDKVSRAAYSLSAIMPNYLAKAGSAMLGGSGSTMHQLGSVSRKAAPYLLAFGLLGASFRFNDKALESELPNYSKLQQLFKKKQYEGLTQEMLRADAINLVQVSIGTGILGTAIASSGAFESVRSFKGTYDLVQQLNDTGGQTTYIQRQQHKLFGMWLEHLAEQQTVNLPILTPEGEFKELEKVRVATADEALDVYKSIDDNIAKGNLLYRRHLNEAARQIDLPLIRTMPTRLGMVSRRVAPIMVGAMVTAQLLSTTEGFRDSPWMSLLKNITGTGSREYSPEQRAMLSRLGINESKYQPETAGDVFNNVRDYLVSAAFLPFGGNAFGVYQDNPNPFSPILGPLGVSMGSADEARIYSQSQSVAADISGSLYLMPAMTDGLGEALNIGPLLSYAKRLEGRPGAASLAKALIRGAGLRTRAAKFKGGPSQRDMQAASSPEMQMELTRRYDRLRNLTWQTAGEHMMDIVGEFQRAGRVISDYRDNKIDGVNINVTRPADVMIFDTLGKMSFQPILQDGRNIKPKKTTERDLLKFVRNMTAQGAGFGEGARLEASEDPSDILYSRSQDRGGLPVLSYFGGLFTYAFNSFYDKDQDALIAGSSNLVGAGLMAGAAIVLGASFIGTTASTVIQLAGSLAALSDYGTLADAKTNVGDLKRSLKTKLRRSSFAIYEPAASAADNNQRIIRPWGKNYGRTLTLNQTITQEVLDQINQNLTGAATFGGYSAGHDLETLVTQRFGETASDLVENMSLQSAGPIESTVTAHVDFLNKKLDDYLTVNVDGKRISIAQVFNPSLEEGVSGISSGASAQIAEVLASGKNPLVQRYEIEHILLDEFHRNLEVITAEKSFDDFGELTGQYQSARTQFGKTQKATEQAAQAKAAGAVNEAVELYDPSIGFLRSKIQQKGYSGLIAEGAGGALRGAGELINLKAYYEILSYTAAMSTTNNFERRRASQAAAQNTIQAFGMIIPMQYALGLIQRNPTLAIGAAVGTAVVGGLALQNKQFGKAVGRFFNPIFSALDKYAYRPAVQGLAGTYEALAQFTPIPQLLSPIASLFDPIFSNIRRSVSQDPSLSMLTNFFVPEGVEDFYQRNAMLKTRMTPWGDSYELYSAKEVGQFYETKMTSRRRRGRVASAGIDDDLLHPFMLGRSADIQSISLFEERYLGGDGRIMDQFRPERMLSNTLMLAIQRRQGMIDQHVEGAYLRRPYHRDNVHQDFAVLNALGRYSYAQTGSLFEAPVNQMARGIGPMMQLYGQFAERVAPYAPITKRAITGAALGYLAGAQFSHFGRNEEERRRNAAVGGSIGAGVGGVLTTAVSPFVEEKAQYHLLNLRKNPLLKGISEKLVSFGAGISSALKAIAGGIGKGLNAAFPYIGFGGLVGAATYSNYDSAVNWIDGEDPAKKHPLYNPWMRFGVSASVGAATTALGFAGTRFSTTNAQYPLAKAIGGSLSVGAKGAGLFAQFGALSFLTNFMLTNNLVGAAPRGMVRAVYDRLGLGRPEDFDNVYDTTSKAISIGVAPLAMFVAGTGHETRIKNLRKTLGYGKVAAGTNVKLEQMAQATREAAEIKELLAKLNGSSVIVEPDPNVQVQLLLNSSAGLSDDLVNNLSTAQKQDIPDLIQKGIQAKEARLSIVNELIDAQVQRGFVHNTLRSTRGVLKTFGNISTLGIGYALRGVLKARRPPALLTVTAFGATLGLLSNETFSTDGDSATGFSRFVSAMGGAYVSLAALGMVQAKGSSGVSLPKPLQRIADWFVNIFDPNVPDAPQSKIATYIKDKFHKLGNWLINLGKDTRSTQFPHGATFPEAGKNLKQPFITFRSAALPVAAFSIDALNLYTSVKQINNLKYGRSQAEFQKAYSSYQSVITTTSFTALMGMFARNASFASFVSSTLQLAGISEKAGYRRGDYEFASLEDISDTSRKELAKAKERDTLTALGVGSLSLVGAGVSYVRANPESVISKAINTRMPFVQSAQMAKAGAAADLLALPIVNTVMTGYEIQRIASDKNQRFGYGNMAANNMAQTRADLLGIGLFALGASLLARRPSASWGRTVLKSAPGIATIGAALSKDAFVDRFQYSYTDRFQKAGITNAYAQNLIARKAAKSTSDNYGLVLGGSILLTAGLMVLTRGKGPSKQFLATLPALATAGTAFANYEMTVNSEINKRKDYRANQGLSSEELTKYEAWQKSDTMFPDEWKDSDQYRNYSLYRKGQEQRWAKWNANYYSSTGIRKGKGLGTQKLLSPWSVPKDVLRENAYMQQTQAMKPFEPNPIAVGLAVAGGGVVGGMALSTIRHAAGPNFKPPDILAKGESFFDAKHRAGSTGQIFGNLAIAAYGVWRFVSNNKDIRDKANQTISGNNAGEIQAIRASADIVLKHDETVQGAFLSQIPTGGNNWVGKSVRQFLGFAIGKSIFEGLVNPWTRANEEKRVADTIRKARKQGINVDSALLQKALKAQAKAQADPMIGTSAGVLQFFATGTNNPLALAEGGANSVMTALGITSALSAAKGMRRFENVMLEKSASVTGAIPKSGNGKIRTASVSGTKEEEESNFVEDYVTNPFIYTHALPRIAGIAGVAIANTWLLRKTWTWTKNAIQRTITLPEDPQKIPVAIDPNPNPNKPGGSPLDPPSPPTAPDGTATLDPIVNPKTGQEVTSNFSNAAPDSQVVIESVINPDPKSSTTVQPVSTQSTIKPLSTEPVKPVAPVQVTTNTLKPSSSSDVSAKGLDDVMILYGVDPVSTLSTPSLAPEPPESISPTLTSPSEPTGPSKLESRKPRFGQIDDNYRSLVSTSKKQALTVGRALLGAQTDANLVDHLETVNRTIGHMQKVGLNNLGSQSAQKYGTSLGERQAILLEQRRRQQQAGQQVIETVTAEPEITPKPLEQAAPPQPQASKLTSLINEYDVDVDGGFIKPAPLPTGAERQMLTQQRADRVRRGRARGIDIQMILMDMVYGKAKESVTGVISKAKEIGQPFVSKVSQAARGTANQAWDGWSIFDWMQGMDARFGNQGIGGGAGFWTRFAQGAKYELSGKGIIEGGFGIGRNAQTGKVGIQGKGGAMALAGMGLQLADDILTLDWSRKNFAKSLGTTFKNQAGSLAAGVAFGLVTAGLGALALSSVPALAALGVVGSAALMAYGIYSLADQGFKVGGKAWEKFVLKRKRTAEEQKAYEQQSQVLSMGFGVGTFVYAGYNQIKSIQGARRAASVLNQAPVTPTVPVRQAVDVIDDVAPRIPVSPARSGAVLKTAGKAVKVASTMYSVYQISTGLHQAFTGKTEQAKDQGRRQVVREIGGLIGMRAGAKVGGYIGRAGGAAVTANPTGAIVGDVAGQTVGGYIGYQGGSNIAERMYDNAMEMMYGKMNQRQRQEAVTKEVKRRSAGSQYNLEAVQAKEQKVSKQMERPRAWWLAEEEEEIPWWKQLLQTIGKGVEALGNFLTRTKNAALEAADALTNWATGGVPLSSEALISGNLMAANSRGTAIIQAAQMLGVNPLDLATIVEFESDGKPHIRGGAGGNYTGLIQFGPNERKKYGYHSKMTFEEQMLGPVVSYFKDRFKSAGMSTEGASLEDLYTTVLAGNPKANRGSRDAFGTSPRSGVRKMTAPGADRDIALQKYFIVDGSLNVATGFQVPSGASWASSMGVRDAKTLAELPQRTGGSRYGNRVHPVTGKHKLHAGEDYAAPAGTPLSSSTPAVVVFAGVQGGYGNTVILRHSNGTFTRSAHLSSVLVKAGDVVMPNQLYGKVGSTGLSTGPHLHFEEGTWDTKSNRFVPKPPTNLGRQSIKIGGTLTKTGSTPPTSPQDYFKQVTSIPVSQGQSQQVITRTERKSTKVGGVTHYAYTNTAQRLVTVADSQAIGGQKQQLNRKAAEQVNKMLADLKVATGVDLWILSGYRSVETQQQLWNAKKRQGKSDAAIAKSLAIPGFSEHHTGDAFDISLQGQADLTAEQWASNPKLRKARAWLDKNQSKYHLETSFLPGNKENVVSEPWHLRYVGEGSEYARQVKANVTATQQIILNQQQAQQNTNYINMPTRGARAYFPGMSTGPRGRIGAGSANHVDIKLKRGVSFDVMVQALDAMATTYATQGLYIRVSNNGATYNPKATHQQKLAFVKKGFDSHWRQDRNYWSMDYYIVPKGGSTSVAERGPARPIAVPLLPGTSVTYAKGGGYGLHAIIKDAKGNVIIKQGHGDTKGAIPTGVSLSAPSEVTPPGLPPISSLPVPPTTPQSSQQQLKQAYQPAGGFKQVKASYYGKGFHGKRTASGEIYNQNALTVAVPRGKGNKPIIPFGTILEVINPANGKRVLVKVTDTGSFGDAKGGLGRGLDLSVAAAKALGTVQAGVASVQYRVVKPANNSKPTQSPTGPKLELPTIKPADTVPLVPTAPAAPSPKPKKKFSILDPSTWLRSEVPTNANPVAARVNSDEGVLIASAGVSDIGMPIISTNKPFSSKQRLLSWNPNDIYTDSQAKPDPNSLYRRLPKPNAPQTASGLWGTPGHRPTPTGNYHDYGKRPPQRQGPIWGDSNSRPESKTGPVWGGPGSRPESKQGSIWGGPDSRPEQTGNYQDWGKVPQRDRATPSVPKVPGHRPEVWDILLPIGNIPGAVHPLDKGKRKKDDFSILWKKRNLPTPPKPKLYPESIKDQIKVQIPGLLVAVVVGGAVVKGGLDADLAQFAQEAQAAVIGAATAAVQLVNQVKEEKASTTIALEHPTTAAAVRPIHQRGQELRTIKRQVVAVADQQDNTVYVSQQVSVHAVQAQLANRDVKVPANPQVEAAAQPRMMNTKAN